jgi:cyclic di-GMP phosphodiesterase
MAFNAERSMTRELEKVYHDTLRNRRPYKPAFDHARTCDLILNGDGTRRPEHFDPRLLKAFRTIHQVFEAIYC